MCDWCLKQKKAQEARLAAEQKRGTAPKKVAPVTCEVIWYYNRNTSQVTVRCTACMVAKKGCSFKDLDWGVAKWPTLRDSDAAQDRRAREAGAKRKSVADVKVKESAGPSQARSDTLPKVKAKGKEVGSVAGLVGPRKEVFEGVLIPPGTLPRRKVAPSPTVAPPLAQGVASTSQVAGAPSRAPVLEDLLRYEAVLSEPNRTPLQVWIQAVSLRAARYQERGNARALLKLVEGWLCLADGVIDRLLADARRLAESAGDDALLGEINLAVAEEIERQVRRERVSTERGVATEETPRREGGPDVGALFDRDGERAWELDPQDKFREEDD